MKNLNFKPSCFLFSLMACFILVSCDAEPDQINNDSDQINGGTPQECNSIPPYSRVWNFEQAVYDISSNCQTVELSVKSDPGYPGPQHWDWMEIKIELHREHLYAGNNINYLDSRVAIDAYILENLDQHIPGEGQLEDVSQFYNEEGQLILSVTFPENDSEYYRVYTLYPTTEGNKYATATIVQAPKQSDDARIMKIRVDGEIYSSTYEFDEDGNYIFADQEFKKMLDY